MVNGPVYVHGGELGATLRRLRRAQRLTIEALAHRADLHPTYLSGIERGIRNPTWGKLSDLALTLGVPLSRIVLDAERAARVARFAESFERQLDE